MKKLKNTISTGEIANYHGELYIMKKADKYYWSLEDFNNFTKKKEIDWKEIPEYLYAAINKFENESI